MVLLVPRIFWSCFSFSFSVFDSMLLELIRASKLIISSANQHEIIHGYYAYKIKVSIFIRIEYNV